MRIILSTACLFLLAAPALSMDLTGQAEIIPIAQKISPGTTSHPPKVTRKSVPASIDLKCGNKIYSLYVPGGICNGTTKKKICANTHGDGAVASCSAGCKRHQGKGTCTSRQQ